MRQVWLINIIFGLAVASCSTPQSLERKPPYYQATSLKPFDVVSGCVGTLLGEFTGHHFIPTVTPEKTTFADTGGISTSVTVAVYKSGLIEVRHGYEGAVGVSGRIRAGIERCL